MPQMVVVSTLTTTSVGSWTVASGTSSQALLPGPWYTSAFILCLRRFAPAVARLLPREPPRPDASGVEHTCLSHPGTSR
ncbi:hypothetical protein Acsp06_19140 [Actinomycetospora sp. NBRC 106375]|nr:hypothetical protein Acsp06_19140 [Actinomycetospora sp. NBRC 106375]